MNVIAVGVGGFAGAIVRYLVGMSFPTPHGFPLGTLIINLIGCFFLAWFSTLAAKWWNINPQLKLAIGTGFIGAFTTFSTFSVETINLIKNHQVLLALIYVLFSIIGGVGLSAGGAKLALAHVKPEGERE